MTDKRNSQEDRNQSSSQSVPLRSAGEVVVTHLDSPPSAGKKSIHTRRLAPIVPERKDKAGDSSANDTNLEHLDSE